MRFSTLLLAAFFGQYIAFTWQAQDRCPAIRLANGRVRVRAKGRIIRFICNEGFILVGKKHATCIRGQYTSIPVCVSAECNTPPTPEHAQIVSKYKGAILYYFCEPGYALIGPTEIYCDGRQWNTTSPYCRDTSAVAPTECDFEKPDLCWWEQDPMHDFDWRRHNFETPSSHIGTGPTHDHTLGAENDGHYLYIEASGRLVNDTARIISPLYNASYTKSGCFSFWYHMYGSTIGALNIYFLQEKENASQLMFTKEGNQGNQWLHGTFELPRVENNFQIIIEGVRGSSYVSDIAIDDVAILQGDKCNQTKIETVSVTPNYDDQVEIINAQQSCRGRCNTNSTVNFLKGHLSWISLPCICTIDCAEHSVCCPDYAEYCILGYTDDTGTDVTETVSVNHEVVTTTTTKTLPVKNGSYVTDTVIRTTDYFHGNGISINPKDDIDPITSGPIAFTTKNPKENASRAKTEKPFRVTSRTTLPVLPTKDTRTKETPFIPATTGTKRYLHPHDQTDRSVTLQDLEKLHRNSGRFSLPGIIGVVCGILTGVSITMLVAFFIMKKRKSYKRGTNGSALSEDSDVRFLTSDEILDFTLARPSDNDE